MTLTLVNLTGNDLICNAVLRWSPIMKPTTTFRQGKMRTFGTLASYLARD